MVSTIAEPGESAPPPKWLRFLFFVVAAIQTASSLSNLSALFDDAPDIPGTSPGGLLISATILLTPVFGLASIFFLMAGRIGRAIVALASITFLTWLFYLPSVVIHWQNVTQDLSSPEGFLVLVALPLVALAAVVLALRGRELTLAMVLAMIPPIAGALGVVAFAISVILYGF